MDHIAAQIPFLRRYARALTGTQAKGDALAASVLEAMIAAPETVPAPSQARIGLFTHLHRAWSKSADLAAAAAEDETGSKAARAQEHLSSLTPMAREALLLFAMEDFSKAEVAAIMDLPQEETQTLIATGQRELAEAARGRVLIIEDEPIIAMDIETIVQDAGHKVIGIAQTHSEALEICPDKPDLILADIRLADESSGIDAVNDLLKEHGNDVPVIFITAYPERFLTGDKPEPAFLITKPFRAEQVLSAVSQAMFFASTETLK